MADFFIFVIECKLVTMCRLIYIFLILSGLLHLESIAQRPAPDTSDCRIHNNPAAISRGTIYRHQNPDGIPAETVVYFTGCENTLLLYYEQDVLSPVIESGLLNANLMLQENFYITDFFCLCDEYGSRLYFDREMTKPVQDTTSCILFYATEMKTDNPHQRIFTILNNYCGNDGFKAFYLVIQNDGKTNNETAFFEGAYIRCLKHWYTMI